MRYAAQGVRDTLVVFNGDVLTQVNLRGLIDFHRGRGARATIVLTPVENPRAYGLVETDAPGNILRFIEKPKPEEITCDTINAGIYVLEPDTFDRIPPDVAWSIERSFFPSFIERRETFLASIYRDYWIDIGTPEKVHAGAPRHHGRPLLDAAVQRKTRSGLGRSDGPGRSGRTPRRTAVRGRGLRGGSRGAPRPVHGAWKNSHVEEDANVSGVIVWAGSRIGREAVVADTIIGRSGRIGRNSILRGGVFGDDTSIADYSRL